MVVGARRLEAHRRLGLPDIEVRVLESVTDALVMAKAERDENTCRKPMTVSE